MIRFTGPLDLYPLLVSFQKHCAKQGKVAEWYEDDRIPRGVLILEEQSQCGLVHDDLEVEYYLRKARRGIDEIKRNLKNKMYEES